MSVLTPLRGRGLALTALCFIHALVSALIASVGTLAVARPLSRHPDGVWALFTEGGRTALDLYRLHGQSLDLAFFVTALAVIAWALVWLLLGGVLPTMFSPRAPSLRDSVAHSIRRAPTLLGLALLVGLSLALCGCIGVFAEMWATRRAAHLASVRDRDLLHAAMLAPSLLLFAMTSVWHDLARTRALGRNLRALQAAGESFIELVRSPWQMFSRASGFALLGALGPLTAALIALGAERHRGLWAVGLLFVAQQSALVWKLLCRALWFAWLSDRPLPTGAPAERRSP